MADDKHMPTNPPASTRRRGRPAIGPRLAVRLPGDLKAALEAAQAPGETLPETARRVLADALIHSAKEGQS